jgi:hypothetical protein
MKNGYACLNASEIELAAKNIDPARPKAEPKPRPAEPAPQRADAGQSVETRVAAARKDAVAATERVVGYTPEAVKRGTVVTGTVLSLTA